MSISAVVRALVAAKATPEMILAAVEAAEAEQTEIADASKEKARARWHKWKAKQPKTNVGKRLQTDANVSKQLARVEDSSNNLDISGEDKQDTPQAAPTPRSELEKVLSPDLADAVIEHRQRLRKPLTARAAKLLAGKLRSDADAEAMIANGWTGFEPEWLANRTKQHISTGPPKQQNPFGGFENFAKKRGWIGEPGSNDSPDEDAGKLSGHHQRQDAGSQVVALRGGLAGRVRRGDS